jgi:hydroxymethylglutaryl-CoA lyase
MNFPSQVTLVDVGPRDGLQNEAQVVPATVKIELVHRLQEAGLPAIEVTSFVSPKWVPQMADNAEVMRGITRRIGVSYSVLVPNLQGWEAAAPLNPDEIVVFAAASEAFSRKNINCSIAESIERFAPVVQAARERGIRVRGAISCALGCPYQGEVKPGDVAYVARLMLDIGVESVDVADTIGTGTPRKVQAVVEAVARVYALERINGHFHDTYGQALANIYACLELGMTNFHSSVAGLGGCPYAKGATGNVATEDVVYLMQGLGIATGIDLARVVEAGRFISNHLGRKPVSRAGNALLARKAAA